MPKVEQETRPRIPTWCHWGKGPVAFLTLDKGPKMYRAKGLLTRLSLVKVKTLKLKALIKNKSQRKVLAKGQSQPEGLAEDKTLQEVWVEDQCRVKSLKQEGQERRPLEDLEEASSLQEDLEEAKKPKEVKTFQKELVGDKSHLQGALAVDLVGVKVLKEK